MIIAALLAVTDCFDKTDQHVVVEEKNKSVQADSLYTNSNKVNDTIEHSDTVLYNCSFDNFIADKKTPKLAKYIYLDKEWTLSNDTEALALLDSLTAKNKNARSFYCKVITKTYKKSDGYFSEGLGHAGKEYVENNTIEFISNFDNKECFTGDDLKTWADIVLLEFTISSEEEDGKKLIDQYIKKLKSNCKGCSPVQQENINQFGLALENKWKDYFKNINKSLIETKP